MVKKETTFTRTLYNQAKLGAYYTELGHARRLGQLFSFGEETCLLEPSIGDASAVKAFLDAAEKKGTAKIFGVELNEQSFKTLSEDTSVDYTLCADFLEGVRISNGSFSICFTNPPYGACGENDTDRLEKRFIEKIFSYLIPGGFLVAILPMAAMKMEMVVRSLLSRFEPLALYRFDDDEYEKYHQVAFIGIRRKNKGVQRSEWQRYLTNEVREERIPYLPDEGKGETIYIVPETYDKNVEIFSTIEFHPEKCSEFVANDSIDKALYKKMFLDEYRTLQIGHPPMPLKRDLLYLCAVAGAGEGIAGSEEDGDIHLQRGVVRKVENVIEDYDEEAGQYLQHVIQSNQISLNYIDNFGNCGTFE